MTNKTALVTGGTDGIGKAIAIGLARAGCEVLIVGRDAEKGVRVESDIRRATGNENVHFLRADLGLVGDTNRLAAEVIRRCTTLSYLVHSAGVVKGQRDLTAEGIESNFAINYLGRFALSLGLLPLLTDSALKGQQSRILMVSGAAKNGTVHFEDVNLTERFGTLRAVSQFCQANDLFTLELADRLAKADNPWVTITCLKVGVVKTNIRRQFPTWMKWLVPLIADPLLALSPEEVAVPALRLINSPDFERVTGAYFQFIKRFKAIDVPTTVRDPEQRRRLWQLSEQLVARAVQQTTRATH
jgi:NAD(P)-dependent dehydrogenase (short-subunit alcohol dehydrogenase family)